jgi:hypothetical protein
MPPRLLDGRHIDCIVLSICADQSYIHHSVRVIDLHDEPILIPRDVKNDPIALQDTSCTKVSVDGRWGRPIGERDLLMPGFQGTFCLWVSLPEAPQRPLGNDAHGSLYHDPKLGATSLCRITVALCPPIRVCIRVDLKGQSSP